MNPATWGNPQTIIETADRFYFIVPSGPGKDSMASGQIKRYAGGTSSYDWHSVVVLATDEEPTFIRNRLRGNATTEPTQLEHLHEEARRITCAPLVSGSYTKDILTRINNLAILLEVTLKELSKKPDER